MIFVQWQGDLDEKHFGWMKMILRGEAKCQVVPRDLLSLMKWEQKNVM